MKKIPTLFKREFENGKVVGITDEVYPGMEWVLEGKGVATIKWDGSCCAIIDGVFYKRFDAKPGRKIPEGAIPCCEPDPITGHHPHWVPVDFQSKADKWFVEAFNKYCRLNGGIAESGTYEAVGKHFNGNPYQRIYDILIPHGKTVAFLLERSFEGIKEYLHAMPIEGIVFWLDGEPKCKIKRKDFGFRWPTRSNNDGT